MKVAFMMASYDTMFFFKEIADKLKAQIKTFPAMPTSGKGGKYGVEYCRWHLFEMGPMEKYNPDVIVLWNGFHEPFFAATSYLKTKYRLLHAEQAWLPQKNNIYLDYHIGSRSTIADNCPTSSDYTEEDKRIFETLQNAYKPCLRPSGLPSEYVLVPLQIESDTSIVLDSPYFKSMDSLIGYALKHSPYPVVVKPHPKDCRLSTRDCFKALEGIDGSRISFYDGPASMNDLAYHSNAVFGINSTSLIEAAIHFKPITQLGHNVFQRGSFLTNFDTVDEGLYIKKLAYIYRNQVDVLNPQQWSIKKITNE